MAALLTNWAGRQEVKYMSEIRFARTFRLTQMAIDGLLDVADVRRLNLTAALELAIAQADAALIERERLKLTILAAHCWRAGALPPHRFRELLDMVADAGGATATALRDERRALMSMMTTVEHKHEVIA
jgi:hypothetical protein